MDSLKIKEFEKSIIDLINQTPFPLEVKRLVFADLLRQLETATNEEVQIQIRKENENELYTDKLGE